MTLSPSFQKHLPGYVKDYNAIKAKGIDIIACVAVNDPFVMDAFGKDGGADGKVKWQKMIE